MGEYRYERTENKKLDVERVDSLLKSKPEKLTAPEIAPWLLLLSYISRIPPYISTSRMIRRHLSSSLYHSSVTVREDFSILPDSSA